MIVELDEALPSLNFDREQLKRVMVNLLDNAIQAMKQKGRVWISTRYDTKRRRAVVSVADEGIGIAPEDQEKLFVPYFSRKKTGTGLGLAIVRRIITDHEGQIQVEPESAERGCLYVRIAGLTTSGVRGEAANSIAAQGPLTPDV